MSANREPVSKKTRFEVFKRDRFTCQYCGAKAPEVVLHCDHINPVAEGGGRDIMNLVTACAGCNGGKGARKLDDRSAVERQRGQIEELESRREQLEMMLSWRDAAQAETIDLVDEVADRIGDRGGLWPNDSGKADIRKWLRQFSLAEVLAAMDEAFDHYMKFHGDEPDRDAWHTAFRKIPVFANMKRQAQDKPYLPRLLYIQGIMRKRADEPRENFVEVLEDAVSKGWDVETLEKVAKRTVGRNGLVNELNSMRTRNHGEG
jgi:hypothetical protein